jgi:DNA polymerase I-like protein with 3'-5' exonuclease and polymerase domains
MESTQQAPPSVSGLTPGTPEYREASRLYQQYYRQRRKGLVMTEQTLAGYRVVGPDIYDSPLPSREGRPDYLAGTKYALAVDTETTGFDWFDEHYPFIATASDFDRDWVFDTRPGKGTEGSVALRKAILEAEVLLFHNLPFDVHMLVAAGIVTYEEIFERECHDTSVLARIVCGVHDVPDFKLKSLGQLFVDADAKDSETVLRERMVAMGLIKKADQKELPDGAYYQVWQAYPADVEAYAMNDTRLTYDLYHVLREKLDERTAQTYALECQVTPVLVGMEARGTALDKDRTSELLYAFEIREQRQREQLVALNDGEEWDPGKDDQLLAVLAKHGIELTETTEKTGKIRTDKGVLARHSGTEIVDTLLDWRVTEKFLSTYLRPLNGRDTVHPSFLQVGAWTGRMACMRPNMQNIPVRSGNEVRSIIVPRDGYVFIDADYSSIELRLLAHYCNHDELWDIIHNGDPFLWLGAQIYGTEDQEKWPVQRQALKNGFYAMTYGAGGPKLASTIGGGMTPVEGRALAKKMKAALGQPYRTLNSRLRAAVYSRGYVRTIGGRRQQVLPDKAYVALNALIQGSSADIMKLALVRAEPALAEFGARPILTVHDEVLAEAPAEYADAALETLKRVMKSAEDLDPTGKLDLKVDGVVCVNNWGEAK